MKPETPRPPLRALDAFAKTLTVAPSLVRQSVAFGGVCVCTWNTPSLDGFRLPENDDLILALHTGGSRGVRWSRDARLSGQRSIPGLVTLIPPGHSVAYHTGGPVSFTNVLINRGALRQFSTDGREPVVHNRFAFRDPFVFSCMDKLQQEALLNSRWSERFVSAVTEALVLHLLRRGVIADGPILPPTPQQKIAAARARIDSNLAGDLSLARLAAEVGMSRAHFARLFRQSVDEPPHQYVMRRRLDRAAALLLETDLALKVIAQYAGFCSQAHLTHLFKKHRGVTLQAYRRLTTPQFTPAPALLGASGGLVEEHDDEPAAI